MRFFFSEHFLMQAKKRRISKKLAEQIYLQAELEYFDTFTGHDVVVAKIKHLGKTKNIMLAYDIIGHEITLITTYPLRENEIENRVKRGRWIVKNEKN